MAKIPRKAISTGSSAPIIIYGIVISPTWQIQLKGLSELKKQMLQEARYLSLAPDHFDPILAENDPRGALVSFAKLPFGEWFRFLVRFIPLNEIPVRGGGLFLIWLFYYFNLGTINVLYIF